LSVRSVLRFHLENFLLRGPLHQLGFLLTLVLAMALAGGALVYAFDSGHHDTAGAAVWWAFLRLTDTGYLGDDHGAFRRLVSTLLTFSGHVVFFGAVVAILTNGFAGAMGFLASGRGRVLVSDHVVVAGEIGQLENLVEELLFVESKRPGRGTLLLLVPQLDLERSARLAANVPKDLRASARVFFRQGNLLEQDAFETASWASARCLIVMHSETLGPGRRPTESAVFKLLLELAMDAARRAVPAPRLVLEVSDLAARRRFARLRWPAEYDIIPRVYFAGQMLAQVVANRGLAGLYEQLLTDQVGQAIHLLRPAPAELVGLTVREALDQLVSSALPIGLVRDRGVLIAVLDERIGAEDGLVVVAEAPQWTPGAVVPPPYRQSTLDVARSSGVGDVLICGTAACWHGLVREIARHPQPHGSIRCLLEGSAPDELPECVTVQHVGSLQDVLPGLDLKGVSRILVLGGTAPGSDAETIACVHALAENPDLARYAPRVICELQRDQHSELVRSLHPEIEILLTDHVLRHVVAQVASKPALYEVYEDLLAAGGSCFASLPLASQRGPISFAQARGWSAARDCIAVGFFVPAAQPGWSAGVHLRPPLDRELELTGGETLLILQREQG
jgi:ion channel POLLUX/CASTOR